MTVPSHVIQIIRHIYTARYDDPAMNTTYTDFLAAKQKHHQQSGFHVDDATLNPSLFPFQRFIVTRALAAGKYAIFADCGMGKTLCQLEWARHVAAREGRPVLILAPLAVSGQTIAEGERFGIAVVRYDGSDAPIQITNYDQLDNIDCSLFAGIVLDESGILKNFEGATKAKIIEQFAATPYKLACTATPSPNDPMELGNHAEFLDVMSRNEMLAMYFVHDGGDTAKWRIKGHATKLFYRWVGQWAVMCSSPADIGFPMEGYDLPPLHFIEHQIETPAKDNGRLFNDGLISATTFNAELRATAELRLATVVDIVNNSTERFIIWVKQNQEGDDLARMIPGAVQVSGSDSTDTKESRLLGFARNEFRVLITKSKIAQFGLNYQNCRNQIFASLDFSFEALYQSVRRSYRFGQTEEVYIHLITTDTMRNVIASINHKQQQFIAMQHEMSEATNVGLSTTISMRADYDNEEVHTDAYHIRRGDCVELIESVPDESIGFSIFSPPFAQLYTYSSHLEDMGNSRDMEEFTTQFSFLVRELYRVLQSGRNVAVHCMDLPIQKGKEGFIGLRDFSGIILRAFEEAGFVYHSRVTIWKDPVVEMQRTKALGLLHKQLKKDSTMSRVGIPDYLLIFRKDGDRNHPVASNIPVSLWQKYASPVWMDIDYSNTLNYRDGRDERDEKHICPLQLPTIERAITLYTNPGDTVLTPFAGIGSEVYQAVVMGRFGIGFELKESYYDLMKRNMVTAMGLRSQVELFSDATTTPPPAPALSAMRQANA